MTKIKLLSALALAVFAANAATVVSADQTVGSIEFDNDTTTIVTPKDPEDPTKPLPPSVDLNDPIVITDAILQVDCSSLHQLLLILVVIKSVQRIFSLVKF